MAWPPPVLPINRTNATPQLDTHAADHNAVNLAVNDLVTHATTAQLPNNIAGTDHWYDGYGLEMVAASIVVITDVNGGATVTFPRTFQHPPIVAVCNGDAASGLIVSTLPSGSLTYFWIKAIWHDGTPVANTGVRVDYIAVGPRT